MRLALVYGTIRATITGVRKKLIASTGDNVKTD